VRDLVLTLAVGRYAITEALLDGSVHPRNVTFRSFALSSPERHWRMLRHQEFDVCELSLAGYAKAVAADPDRWAAVPVFPHRRFRHGYVFTSTAAGISSPEELGGRVIGLRTWGTTAGLWMRGILQDHHGLDLHSVRWVTEHAESAASPSSGGFRVEPATAGLPALLGRGDLAAVIYPERLRGADIRPVFPDPDAAERAYAAGTGLFPIMHLVAVRRSLLEEHPWLAVELVTAFELAKAAAWQRASNPRWLPLAWGEQALAEQRAVLGEDPWRYGLQDNLPELTTALRYAAEQGLTPRRLEPSELFWPSTHTRPPSYAAVH
jgi:4,5-dihydroxyphthalate decarboxylase